MTVHDASPEAEPTPGAAERVRGVLVIAAALLVGFLLVNRALEDEDPTSIATEAAAVVPTTTAPAGPAAADVTTTTTPAPPSTTTTVAVRPPSEVQVVVLNGSGRPGEAARGAAALSEAGYTSPGTGNAAPAPSAVYYAEGYEAEARAVAEAIEVDPAQLVQPLDEETPPAEDLGQANVVVIIGTDDTISF